MSNQFLLWDHDGVLVDTERLYFEASRRTLADELDVELTREMYLRFNTQGGVYTTFAKEQNMPKYVMKPLREKRNALYQALIKTEPIEIEGIEDVLADLGRSHRMAIVTTSRRSDFEIIHEHRNITRHFEFVLTLEDYGQPKPHPAPYLAGLRKFDAQPDNTLVIEDSKRGLASAVAAGLRCIMVHNDFMAEPDYPGAWKVARSVNELPDLIRESTA